MIRVLHFGLDSSLGGIETYLYKLYNNIDRDNFIFDFLVIGDEKPCWYDEFTAMGSRFYKVTPRSKNPIRNRKEIQKIIKENNFDILHCHLNTLSYITPVQEAIKQGVPVIVHSRNAGTSKSIISNILHRVNFYRLPKNKITKLAVSTLAGEWLFGKKSNYTVVNNGINIERYRFNNENRDRIRKEFNIGNELVVIHLGAMREQKNHMFILEIFKEVLNLKKDVKLLLVGDGDLKEEIINRSKELNLYNNVIITGNRNDANEILCAGDIFLFPSLFEGFPNAVLEAQTTGLPCLISNSITKEVMIDNQCFSLSLDIDSRTWANKLLEIQTKSNREDYADSIKRKGYSVEDEIFKITSIYNELTNKK